MKNSVFPTAVSDVGDDAAGPVRMSLTMYVPDAVPSLRHSSAPLTPSSAAKYAIPPTSVLAVGFDPYWIVLTSRISKGASARDAATASSAREALNMVSRAIRRLTPRIRLGAHPIRDLPRPTTDGPPGPRMSTFANFTSRADQVGKPDATRGSNVGVAFLRLGPIQQRDRVTFRVPHAAAS